MNLPPWLVRAFRLRPILGPIAAAAARMFGNGRGEIEAHGVYGSPTKRGPGRYGRKTHNPAGSKLWKACHAGGKGRAGQCRGW